MNHELTPLSEPGRHLVELAEQHAADFATRADQHDREGSFPFENFEALKQSGVMAAPVPEQFGGLGVDSLYDLILCMNRIGRGDGSTAIALNMHLNATRTIARQWQVMTATGQKGDAALREGLMRTIAAGNLVTSILVSEPGGGRNHPMTEATASENGWLLNGRKIFGTLSPIANLFFVRVRVREDGRDETSLAILPRGTPGMEIKDNWDALGMRASGSNDVVFTDCAIPRTSLVGREPWGRWTAGGLQGQAAANLGLVAAFLGIAEAARDSIVGLVTSRKKGPAGRALAERPAIQRTIAEIEIDLAAARAMLDRSARHAEEYFAEHAEGEGGLDEAHAFMKDFQCTKWFVQRTAIEIADRALQASGGSGYLTASPLSRMYRDVRAGPFMQAYSPNEAFEYIGRVTLGLDPEEDA